jgi:hypothetical protein
MAKITRAKQTVAEAKTRREHGAVKTRNRRLGRHKTEPQQRSGRRVTADPSGSCVENWAVTLAREDRKPSKHWVAALHPRRGQRDLPRPGKTEPSWGAHLPCEGRTEQENDSLTGTNKPKRLGSVSAREWRPEAEICVRKQENRADETGGQTNQRETAKARNRSAAKSILGA